MAAGTEANDYLIRAYHAVMRDGSVAATLRDAVKDVRNMFMEVFFGKGERGGEPGSPLNPLFHDLVEARKQHGSFQSSGPQAPPMREGMSAMTSQNLPTPSQ